MQTCIACDVQKKLVYDVQKKLVYDGGSSLLTCLLASCAQGAQRLKAHRCLHAAFSHLLSVLQKQQKALPHLTEPHDSLRLGVHTLKDRASVNHPVEAIEEQVPMLQCAHCIPFTLPVSGNAALSCLLTATCVGCT